MFADSKMLPERQRKNWDLTGEAHTLAHRVSRVADHGLGMLCYCEGLAASSATSSIGMQQRVGPTKKMRAWRS